MSREMDLEDGLVYLNNASIGPLPKKSLEMLNDKNLEQARIGERKIDYQSINQLWDSLRSNVSALLGGKIDGVSIQSNENFNGKIPNVIFSLIRS